MNTPRCWRLCAGCGRSPITPTLYSTTEHLPTKEDKMNRMWIYAAFALGCLIFYSPAVRAQSSHPANGLGTLGGLMRPHEGTPKHEGSWYRSGGNGDARYVKPGETITLLDYKGAGIARRFWVTIAPRAEMTIHRQAIPRMYWD